MKLDLHLSGGNAGQVKSPIAPSMYHLQFTTSTAWVEAVIDNMPRFLQDHAACEKKASSMALSLVSHYPDKPQLVAAMIDLAIEELNHFREVVKLLDEQQLQLAADQKDPYVNQFRKSIRRGRQEYLLDQLLIASIIEARGAERFGLLADALPDGRMKEFYGAITRSELRHQDLFLDLANLYIDQKTVMQRLEQLLTIEAELVAQLPVRAALH